MDAQFLAPGQATTIAGHRIPGGMIYVGKRLRAADHTPIDPCLVDPGLMVARGMPDTAGNLMGYFPSYETLKPTSRLAYLLWLSGGRRGQGFDVGYPFLFLYGLERALLVDRFPTHRAQLLAEVKALIDAYGHNNSFLTYATQLADAAAIEYGVTDANTLSSKAGLELLLGAKVARGETASVEEGFRLAIAAERQGTRFLQTCWEEMLEATRPQLRALPQQLDAGYFTGRSAPFIKGASASHQALRLEGLPDVVFVMEESSTIREDLRRIAKATMKAFRAYQDLIQINPSLRGTEDALHLIALPGPKRLDPVTVAKKIAPWADDAYPATLGELNRDMPGLFGKKLDIKAMREGEESLAKHGLAIVPSSLLGEIAKADAETTVRVIRMDPAIDPVSDLGPSWAHASRLALLANAITQNRIEEERLAAGIAGLFPKLDARARDRLPAFIWWRRTSATPNNAINSLLKTIPDDLKRPTALFCVGVAVLAGLQDDDGVRTLLERAYKSLGQDPASLWNDLHAATAAGGKLRRRPDGTGIDHRRVAEIAAETDAAASLLAGIFRDEEPAAPAPAAPKATSGAGEGVFPGLKPALATLLSRFRDESSVPSAVFDAAARELGLMTDGAIEAINEWAFERIDIPLIEPNGTNIQIEWTEIGALAPAA